MVSPPRILIVGAGLAGLALFRVLQRSGIEAELIEREESNRGGAGIFLTGNALKALDAIDRIALGDRVRTSARRVSEVSFRDHHGNPLFELVLPWTDFMSIERSALRDVLLDSMHPAKPSWSSPPTRFERCDDGIRVTHADGRSQSYDLVVGADGVHSQVAQQLLGHAAHQSIPDYYGWRFVVNRPREIVQPIYMIGNGRTLLFHPLPGDRLYCGAGPIGTAVERPDGSNEREAVIEAFRDFAAPAPAVFAQIDDTTELIPTRYWQIERDAWQRDRSVLIGDAAHACVPTLAQGGAMAFEDALVLGQMLVDTESIPDALAAFERRRRERVALVQRESLARLQTNAMLDDKRLELRNQVMRKVGRERLQSIWNALVTTAP